jgi:hypothetical protein
LYDQDAAIIKTKGSDEVNLLWGDGNIESVGMFSPNKVAQAYSKMNNGRTFVFEKVQQPVNNMGKMAFNKIGQMW